MLQMDPDTVEKFSFHLTGSGGEIWAGKRPGRDICIAWGWSRHIQRVNVRANIVPKGGNHSNHRVFKKK